MYSCIYIYRETKTWQCAWKLIYTTYCLSFGWNYSFLMHSLNQNSYSNIYNCGTLCFQMSEVHTQCMHTSLFTYSDLALHTHAHWSTLIRVTKTVYLDVMTVVLVYSNMWYSILAVMLSVHCFFLLKPLLNL